MVLFELVILASGERKRVVIGAAGIERVSERARRDEKYRVLVALESTGGSVFNHWMTRVKSPKSYLLAVAGVDLWGMMGEHGRKRLGFFK